MPFVAEAEATLYAGGGAPGGDEPTNSTPGRLLGSRGEGGALQAAGVGVVGAVVGHAAQYGAEKAGASASTAHNIGLGSAALAGAALGSLIIPGVGTLYGGIIGGGAAALIYLWTSN